MGHVVDTARIEEDGARGVVLPAALPAGADAFPFGFGMGFVGQQEGRHFGQQDLL